MNFSWSRISKTIDKVDIVLKLILRIGVLLVALFLALPLTYLAMSFQESLHAPADFYVSVTPAQIYPGSEIDLNFLGMTRYKVCAIHRVITVLTYTDSRIYTYEQPDVKVSGLGKIDPFKITLKLSGETSLGPAKINLNVKYKCPGNIIQKYYPTIRDYSATFNVTDISKQ